MEDNTAIPQEDTPNPNHNLPQQCRQADLPVDGVTPVEGFMFGESRVNGSQNDPDSGLKLLNSDELISDSICSDEHPDEKNVCEIGGKQNVCMEENPSSIALQKPIIELQAKPGSGISGVKRKAETLEKPSKEDTSTKWYCSLCDISVTSEACLNNHIEGRKHKAKEAKSISNNTPRIKSMDLDASDNSVQHNAGPTDGNGIIEAKKWHCSLCQVSATSEALLNAHFLGKKHKAKEASVGLDPKIEGKDGSENVKNEGITKWYCSVCKVYSSSENNLQDHFQGKKHKSKESGTNPTELGKSREYEQEMKETPSSLPVGAETGKLWHCKMCNEETRDEASMNAHRKSSKHRKVLRESCGGVIVVSRVATEAVGKGVEVAQELPKDNLDIV